jgi:hypothetical protein
MAPTIRDIAKAAGVSIATVSRVINGIECVSDKTKSRILSVISQSHYCPNSHAVELVRARTKHSRLRRGKVISRINEEMPRESIRKPGSSKLSLRDKEVDSLRRENLKLRNVVIDLRGELEKWRKRRNAV